jgi:ParB family chromosome partitioning protein
MSKKRLGRDLGSLLSATPASASDRTGDSLSAASTDLQAQGSNYNELAITDIEPSPYQPRREFDTQSLNELAASIKAQGLLQPILVRPRPQGGYEVIAGERRWRAAQIAGLTSIAVVVRQVNDREASALALIENMQREDLNALEEALGLARLRDEFELTQQQIADQVGKSREAIANLLRLLNLGSAAKSLLQSGALGMGHARALLALEGLQQDNAAQEVVAKELSVRATEVLVKRLANPAASQRPPDNDKDADTLHLERRLTDRLGAPVNIKQGRRGHGELVIKYSSLDELDGVLKHLGVDE